MMALKATSATTGRTKNQAFWLTRLAHGLTSHHPAVFVDLRMGGIEAEMRAALGNRRRPRGTSSLIVLAGGRGLDDAVAAGIEHLDDVDRDAVVARA